MTTCPECGAEFEDDTCPECGWSEEEEEEEGEEDW
jgi:anaerobic ribonucleoside-triphosphate reductase